VGHHKAGIRRRLGCSAGRDVCEHLALANTTTSA
jgi:hypothetical protein